MNASETVSIPRPAGTWEWIKEKWVQIRLILGAIDAEGVERYGEAGVNALASTITEPYKEDVRLSSIITAEHLLMNPVVGNAIVSVLLSNESRKMQEFAVNVLGRSGNSAIEAMGLVDALEKLRKVESGAILRGEAPDREVAFLKGMAKRALVNVAERLPFEELIVMARCGSNEARMWALTKVTGIGLTEKEVDALRGLERNLRDVPGGGSRQEIGRIRWIIDNWKADRMAMGRVNPPQKKPEPARKARNVSGKLKN